MDDSIILQTKEALEKNNTKVQIFETKGEVVPYLQSQMKKGSSCAVGGSLSLNDCGVLEFLRSGDFTFYDRYKEGVDTKEVFRQSFFASYYLASCNAVTRTGELYFQDGGGNRIAAITYGPDKVFLVVSTDKIVNNLQEAALRVKTIAAPKNAKRFAIHTACEVTGHCGDLSVDDKTWMCGFQSRCKHCFCGKIAIFSHQVERQKDRIEVLFVKESIGY